MEGNPFFPRFQPNSAGGGVQTPSSLCSQGGQQPSSLPPGFLPRMGFPSMPPIAQQSPQPLSKASSLKGTPENRSRQGDESSGSGANTGAPPGIVHNTLRKTKSDMKVIHRYLVQVKNDTREIHEIPPQDLCNYIQVGLHSFEVVLEDLFSLIMDYFFLGLHRNCQEKGRT